MLDNILDKAFLEQACKEIIETILFCLPNAYKGTVYLIGSPPKLTATRITSGIISSDRETISWGLPEDSEYNPPGKPWLQYRDETGRALEAMAWCVEKQRSWTAENPENDQRSVKLQLEGIQNDTHHMEPVLIRKEDLYKGSKNEIRYPQVVQGGTIWQDSEYLVAAVIKIHFQEKSIRIGGPATKVIKRLSRTLGTELLSYELRQESLDAMEHLAEDRLNSCNILADALRNTITKSGLILSLIKLELGFLRRQWEKELLKEIGKKGIKQLAVENLNSLLSRVDGKAGELAKELVELQERFLEFSLPPERGENWIRMKIEKRWMRLLERAALEDSVRQEIKDNLEQLKRSLYQGKDPDNLNAYGAMSDSLKQEWVDLIYNDRDQLDSNYLNRLLQILEEPSLKLPFKEKSKKSILQLKTMRDIMDDMEKRTNRVLREVLNGKNNGKSSG